VVVVETGGRPVVVGGDVAVWFGELDEPLAQPCWGGGICRLCPYSRRRRCPPSPSARGKAPLERRPVAAQAGICAAQAVKEISLKHRLRWAKLQPSGGSTQPAPESFTSRQAIPAGHAGAASRSAPKIGHCRSQNRTKRTSISRHDHMSKR
jgi:hypothetical protein